MKIVITIDIDDDGKVTVNTNKSGMESTSCLTISEVNEIIEEALRDAESEKSKKHISDVLEQAFLRILPRGEDYVSAKDLSSELLMTEESLRQWISRNTAHTSLRFKNGVVFWCQEHA